MIEKILYRKLQQELKSKILSGEFKEGDLLPSENDLTESYQVTRTTVRQALNELVREGYIYKHQGKGSIVAPRQRRTLGLLSVKGFSQVVSEKKQAVQTLMIEKPKIKPWEKDFFYPVSAKEKQVGCIFLKRLRCVELDPVMLESTYIADMNLPDFCVNPFVNGSLFETLNKNYQIEITRVEQDLRAVIATDEECHLLKIPQGSPLLHILLKFHTNRPYLCVYSSLLCNTEKFSIGNNL